MPRALQHLWFWLILSCAEPSGVKQGHEQPALNPAPAAGGDSTCPRVERAARMWSGFLVDVPNEAMVQALDVVVPIQVALGETFCPPARSDCRPSRLLAVELTDANADEAHVRSALERAGATHELSLILRRGLPREELAPSSALPTPAEPSTWRPDPDSLAEYLRRCRAETAKAAPR
jgi:hypothetical protein